MASQHFLAKDDCNNDRSYKKVMGVVSHKVVNTSKKGARHTSAECVAMGNRAGYDCIGRRNEKHPTDPESCFAYPQTENKQCKTHIESGGTDDAVHEVYYKKSCWKKGHGLAPTGSTEDFGHPGMTEEECKAEAEKNHYKVVGHRNARSTDKPNTCFHYKDADHTKALRFVEANATDRHDRVHTVHVHGAARRCGLNPNDKIMNCGGVNKTHENIQYKVVGTGGCSKDAGLTKAVSTRRRNEFVVQMSDDDTGVVCNVDQNDLLNCQGVKRGDHGNPYFTMKIVDQNQVEMYYTDNTRSKVPCRMDREDQFQRVRCKTGAEPDAFRFEPGKFYATPVNVPYDLPPPTVKDEDVIAPPAPAAAAPPVATLPPPVQTVVAPQPPVQPNVTVPAIPAPTRSPSGKCKPFCARRWAKGVNVCSRFPNRCNGCSMCSNA